MVLKSVFYVDLLIPHKARHAIVFVLSVLIIIGILGSAASYKFASEDIFEAVLGSTFILLSSCILFAILEGFFRFHYFKTPAATFEYFRLYNKLAREDKHPALIFLESKVGKLTMARVGVGEKAIEEFIKNRPYLRKKLEEEFITLENSLGGWGEGIYDADKEFADLLFQNGIQKEDFMKILLWVERDLEIRRQKEWWWSEESLSSKMGLAKDWAYAQTWALDKFSFDISNDPSIIKPSPYFVREDEVEQIEAILSRAKEANALLIGPPGVGKKEVVRNLAYKVVTGTTVRRLRYRRVVFFNSLFLVSAFKTKGDFEEKLISILNEANMAGNIILVISDFPEFINSATALGTDVGPIISKFLGSSKMQVIALANEYQYHHVIEQRRDLLGYFEKIQITEPDEEKLLLILEETIKVYERNNGLFFTYMALHEIASGVKRYFVDGVLPDKAIDFVGEVASWALKRNIRAITKEVVSDVIEEKTAIPVGEIKEEEKEKLLNLEKSLHERVIGQMEAIKLISDALRRARTDIQNRKRPMGSFLFLGPTGVGKTETAKALSETFFDGEEHLLRIDMSEYQEEDSIERLIGSFDRGKPGTLSNMLRSHPYGVLLLDEFEKASDDVHDLFLQVFDEGFFSDMNARKVNARNLILIATSNAASDLIFEAVKSGKKLDPIRDEIVDSLIKTNIFKPELINRFDAVVLFHPLEKEHLEKIAIILLEKLGERLEEKHIHLVMNDAIVNAAIRHGYDPKFGAREMRRAIQEKIQNIIAEKIIKGEVKDGDDLTLTDADLE